MGDIVFAQCLSAAFGMPDWPGALKGLICPSVCSTLLFVNSRNAVGGACGGLCSVKWGTDSGGSLGVRKFS